MILSFVLKVKLTSNSFLISSDKTANFEMSDFYNSVGYRSLHKKQGTASAISNAVVVSTDNCSIFEISEIIKNIESHNPKVIGLDIVFQKHEDSIDAPLVDVIKSCHSIVIPCYVDSSGCIIESPLFDTMGFKKAIINFPPAKNGAVRRYQPRYTISPTSLNCFAMELCLQQSPSKYQRQMNRLQKTELISYYNFSPDVIDGQRNLLAVDSSKYALLENKIKNKIVILGAINNSNDMHITSNRNRMPGTIIHAAIVDTILNENQINDASKFVNTVVLFVFTTLFSLLVIWRVKKKKVVYNLVFRIIQGACLLLGLRICVYLYIRCKYYVDIMPTLISIGFVLLSYDIVYGFDEIVHYIANRKKQKK